MFYPTSFLKGMGSIFSLFGNYYNFKIGKNSQSLGETIGNDWKMIGQDFYHALSKFPRK